MAEISSLTFAKLEQLRVEHNARLDAIVTQLTNIGNTQISLLNYQIDILRDIRMGLSLALGEDLSSYSESGEGNVAMDEGPPT